MRAPSRIAVAILAVAAALSPVAVAHGAAAATDRTTTAPSTNATKAPSVLLPAVTAAAWYQPDPLCSTPLCGVIKLPAISPYPKGTYVVGTAAGRETSSAFIAVHLGKRGLTAHGGTLTVPLDTTTTDGSINPQAAKVKVCVTYQAVTDVEGGFDGAPSATCLPAVPAKYVATPQPHLVANLKRLAGKLSGVKGFALLPADISATVAWQIAFRLPTAKSQTAQRPSVKLLLGDVSHPAQSTPSPTSTPTSTPSSKSTVGRKSGGGPSGGSDGGSSGGSVGGGLPTVAGGGAAGAPVPTQPPTVSSVPPSNQHPVVAEAATTPTRRFVTVGYQYPEIWLLPILALVLVPFTLRSLTRDLTRRDG